MPSVGEGAGRCGDAEFDAEVAERGGDTRMVGGDAGRNGHRRSDGGLDVSLTKLGVSETSSVESSISLHVGLE